MHCRNSKWGVSCQTPSVPHSAGCYVSGGVARGRSIANDDVIFHVCHSVLASVSLVDATVDVLPSAVAHAAMFCSQVIVAVTVHPVNQSPHHHTTLVAAACCDAGLPIAVKDVTAVKGLPFTEVI